MQPLKDFIHYYKDVANDLHKSSYRGNHYKVQQILGESRISLYKETTKATPLSLAICRGHENITDMLVKVYEKDLKYVPNYLKDNNIVLKEAFEYSHSYALALGVEQIERVRTELTDIIGNFTQVDNEELKITKCNIILLKANNTSEPEALFLFPRDRNEKIKLFDIVCDLIEQNGICSIKSICDDYCKTVMHCAAMVGATDLIIRLMDLGGDPYYKTNCGQTPIGMAFNYSQISTFITMCRKLKLSVLKLNELVLISHIYTTNVESQLLLIEYLVDERIEQFQDTRNMALTNIFSMNEILYSLRYGDVGEKCFEKYGEFINEPEHLLHTIWGLINFPQRNSEIFVRLFEKYETRLDDAEKTKKLDAIFHNLIRLGLTNEVRQIYGTHARYKEILFRTFEAGTETIKYAIDANHVELVTFLLDHHEEEMSEPKVWSRLLFAISRQSSVNTDLFMRILDHPLSDPNMVYLRDNHENCLFGAVYARNLENFRLILTSGKIGDISKIRNSYGESLLFPTIYAKCKNRIYYGMIYQFDADGLKRLAEEEPDDENEIEQRILECDGRWGGTQYLRSIDERIENEKADDMNTLFEMLLEMGADAFIENRDKGGILRAAVIADNDVIVRKLLALGLDINKPDRDGNQPIHFVTTVKMLNLLISKSSLHILTSKNNNGETLLHRLSQKDTENHMELVDELIKQGVNINEVDSCGNSIFYCATTSAFCEYLLAHGANPHLKNFDGETPLFHALNNYRFAVANILPQLPDINLFDLTTNGTSYLNLFIRIHQSCFHYIEKTLDLHRNDFLKLCHKHCNDKIEDDWILLRACTSNDYVATAMLTNPNLNIDIVSSCLHVAVRRNKIARLLIEYGADVNGLNIYNETPLIDAIRFQNMEIVDCLIDSGAKINFKFTRGMEQSTPLHVACQYGNIRIIQSLINAGADVDSTNEEGKKPFDYLAPDYRCILEGIWKD